MSFKPFCGPKGNSTVSVTYEIYSLRFAVWKTAQKKKKQKHMPKKPQTNKQTKKKLLGFWLKKRFNGKLNLE